MELSTSEKIKVLCRRGNINITEVAARIGWSQSNLSNKLKRDNFSESDLRKIADVLGYDLIIDFVEKK